MVTPFLAEASLGENTDTAKIDEGEYVHKHIRKHVTFTGTAPSVQPMDLTTDMHDGFSDKLAQRVSWIGPTVAAVVVPSSIAVLGCLCEWYRNRRSDTNREHQNENQSENVL